MHLLGGDDSAQGIIGPDSDAEEKSPEDEESKDRHGFEDARSRRCKAKGGNHSENKLKSVHVSPAI